MIRNYSKAQNRNIYTSSSITSVRTYTAEKRLQELHTLKDSQVKVGKYKYSIEQELGKGYSSKVYKGVQIQRIHKRYAIKVIQLRKFRASSQQLLDAQIQIHRNLDHQNIVKLHQVIKTNTHYYIVMEYCPHGSLHQYIKQKKKLTQSNCLEIMEQIIAGYRYLIQMGVIHRDLKPANVLRIGNKWKISDFGFAVKTKYGFKDKINVGTPLYMAPQSLSKNYYSVKTDIFALGVSLFEMLQGRIPWECKNEKQLLEKISEGVILSNQIKNYKLREFIIKCCRADQASRMEKQELEAFTFKMPQGEEERHKLASSKSMKLLAQFNERLHASLSQSPFKCIQNTLSNQLALIHHLYSCVRNPDSFLFDSSLKEVFLLGLFKLVLKLIRMLTDRKANALRFKNYEQWICSKEGISMQSQAISKAQKYQKQYLQYIKNMDMKIIRATNRKYPQLCTSAPLNNKFYTSFLVSLSPLIRQHNHNLMVLHTANPPSNDHTDKYQALESLYQIYRIAELRSHQQQIGGMERIKVIQKYSQSKIKVTQYSDLRRMLRNV